MTKRCFVIMPFSATTEKHTAAYWNDFFFKFVKPSIEKLGYSCSLSEAHPSNIIKDIFRELLNADLVLAVLTDFNANVWYELGIRHALRKGTIMMIEEGKKLPFDISQYGVIKYKDTMAGASVFVEKLRSFVQKIEVDQPADNPVIDFLGIQVYNDYRQRIEDMETIYRSKLDKIMQLLEESREDRLITEKPKEKKSQLLERKVLQAIMEPYLQQRVVFDITVMFEYFAAEELAEWLYQVRESRGIKHIERVWRKIYERFDKHIVRGVGNQLPRMKEIASKQSSMKLNEIPVAIRTEAGRLAHLYPQLIQLIEEFMEMVRKQSKEIEQKNFQNIVRTAIILDRQIQHIKMVANTVIRDLYHVVISVYVHLTDEY